MWRMKNWLCIYDQYFLVQLRVMKLDKSKYDKNEKYIC